MANREDGFSVTTDVVAFGLVDERLGILLVRDAETGRWSLPMATPQPLEDLDASAMGALQAASGLDRAYCEQLYTVAPAAPEGSRRRVSVAYLCLVAADRVSGASLAGVWFPMRGLPPLAPGHEVMITSARQRLTDKIGYSTIGFQLMPRTFTLTELQETFERVLHEPLDKRNFRKRMLGLGELEDTGQRRRHQSHRPARLFRLRHPDRVAIIK